MAFSQQVAALYNAVVNSNNVVLQRWPNATAGVAVTAGNKVFGVWTQLIAAGKIKDPSWLVGIVPSVATAPTADEEYGIDLATGASGSEVSLSSGTATAQGLAGFAIQFATAVGEYSLAPISFAVPVRVAGAPRISAAVAEFLVGSTSVSLAFLTAAGIGT